MWTNPVKQRRLAEEIVDCWLSQKADGTRNETVSFKGKSIYSYHWWEIARFSKIKTNSGKKIVLIRTEKFSNTSEWHRWVVVAKLYERKDILVVPLHHVPRGMGDLPSLNKEDLIKYLELNLQSLGRKRPRRTWSHQWVRRSIDEIESILLELNHRPDPSLTAKFKTYWVLRTIQYS